MTRKAESNRQLKKRITKIFQKKKVEKTQEQIDKYVKIVNAEGKIIKIIKNN